MSHSQCDKRLQASDSGGKISDLDIPMPGSRRCRPAKRLRNGVPADTPVLSLSHEWLRFMTSQPASHELCTARRNRRRPLCARRSVAGPRKGMQEGTAILRTSVHSFLGAFDNKQLGLWALRCFNRSVALRGGDPGCSWALMRTQRGFRFGECIDACWLKNAKDSPGHACYPGLARSKENSLLTRRRGDRCVS